MEDGGDWGGIRVEVGGRVEGRGGVGMEGRNVGGVYGGYDIGWVLGCFDGKVGY